MNRFSKFNNHSWPKDLKKPDEAGLFIDLEVHQNLIYWLTKTAKRYLSVTIQQHPTTEGHSMKQRDANVDKEFDFLDDMIREIIVDTYGDEEKLWAFLQAFSDNVNLPVDGFVIGEPVSVIDVDYDGNQRRGLTARCCREDGSEHVVAVSEIVFPQASAGALQIAAYRKWLNLDPFPAEVAAPSRTRRLHKATADHNETGEHSRCQINFVGKFDLNMDRKLPFLKIAFG